MFPTGHARGIFVQVVCQLISLFNIMILLCCCTLLFQGCNFRYCLDEEFYMDGYILEYKLVSESMV